MAVQVALALGEAAPPATVRALGKSDAVSIPEEKPAIGKPPLRRDMEVFEGSPALDEAGTGTTGEDVKAPGDAAAAVAAETSAFRSVPKTSQCGVDDVRAIGDDLPPIGDAAEAALDEPGEAAAPVCRDVDSEESGSA